MKQRQLVNLSAAVNGWSKPCCLKRVDRKLTVVRDSIHGHMEFDSETMRVVDDPLFQRLRNLQQLSACQYVFPDATHTRFAHSLGVAHLANRMARTVQDQLRHRRVCADGRQQCPLSREELISDRAVFLITLAGLCHDLGHGPLSHAFEPAVERVLRERGVNWAWSHEDASEFLFDDIVDRLNERSHFLSERERETVKCMIRGKGEKFVPREHAQGSWNGADEADLFLYQIVANKQTGIDVDKLDYLLRDAHHTGVRLRAPTDTLLRPEVRRLTMGDRSARVLSYPDSAQQAVSDLFSDRFHMHQQVYQQPLANATVMMLQEVFFLARNYLSVFEAVSEMRKPRTGARRNASLYAKLTDSVLQQIKFLPATDHPGFPKEDVEKAQWLLSKAESRRPYSSPLFDLKVPAATLQTAHTNGQTINMNSRTIGADITQLVMKERPALRDFASEFALSVRTIDHTNGHANPVACVPFHQHAFDDCELLEDENVDLNTKKLHFRQKMVCVYIKTEDEAVSEKVSELLHAALSAVFSRVTVARYWDGKLKTYTAPTVRRRKVQAEDIQNDGSEDAEGCTKEDAPRYASAYATLS